MREKNDEVPRRPLWQGAAEAKSTEEKDPAVRRHVEEHVRPRKQRVGSLRKEEWHGPGTGRKGASDGSSDSKGP